MLRLRLTMDSQRADEERPAAPQDDGRGEHELAPREEARGHEMAQRLAGHHVAHDEDEQRDRQREAQPESPGHVDQLGIGPLVHGHRAPLQGHPADRARARSRTHDLGMHRTRPFLPGQSGRGRHRLERHAALRAGTGARLANLRVHRTGVLDRAARRRRRLTQSGDLAMGGLVMAVVVTRSMVGRHRSDTLPLRTPTAFTVFLYRFGAIMARSRPGTNSLGCRSAADRQDREPRPPPPHPGTIASRRPRASRDTSVRRP